MAPVGMRRELPAPEAEQPMADVTSDREPFAEFVDAVRVMRTRQKTYFETRNHLALRESKAAEQKVDQLLIELTGARPGARSVQGRLF